jgi:hypothetical protein
MLPAINHPVTRVRLLQSQTCYFPDTRVKPTSISASELTRTVTRGRDCPIRLVHLISLEFFHFHFRFCVVQKLKDVYCSIGFLTRLFLL